MPGTTVSATKSVMMSETEMTLSPGTLIFSVVNSSTILIVLTPSPLPLSEVAPSVASGYDSKESTTAPSIVALSSLQIQADARSCTEIQYNL